MISGVANTPLNAATDELDDVDGDAVVLVELDGLEDTNETSAFFCTSSTASFTALIEATMLFAVSVVWVVI